MVSTAVCCTVNFCCAQCRDVVMGERQELSDASVNTSEGERCFTKRSPSQRQIDLKTQTHTHTSADYF